MSEMVERVASAYDVPRILDDWLWADLLVASERVKTFAAERGMSQNPASLDAAKRDTPA